MLGPVTIDHWTKLLWYYWLCYLWCTLHPCNPCHLFHACPQPPLLCQPCFLFVWYVSRSPVPIRVETTQPAVEKPEIKPPRVRKLTRQYSLWVLTAGCSMITTKVMLNVQLWMLVHPSHHSQRDIPKRQFISSLGPNETRPFSLKTPDSRCL